MEEKKQGHEQILNIILDKNEITWQSIIYDLINKEQMDPWDVNVSLLTQRYIEMIKTLKEHDFRVSGKVVLAAAILLKIKSSKWIQEDIATLDGLFNAANQEDDMEDLLSGIENEFEPREIVDAHLIPRAPQPRKRKVSIYDLVSALEKALEVKHRRVLRDIPILDMRPPVKKKDISLMIKDTYLRIADLKEKKPDDLITFNKLIPTDSKEDKVYTFIPLLHLTNQRKIDIEQYQHFGEILIFLKNKEVENELGISPS